MNATLTTKAPPIGLITETIRIQPSHGWVSLKLDEFWHYRELLFFLVWRDIKVRYKQTILGGAWAIIQPFMTMVVFSLFFGKLGKIPSDNIPYPIFCYAALVPWTFFTSGIAQSSESLIGNANLIKKVYFPRLTIPTAAVLSGVVDFTLAFVLLILMMAYFGIRPTARILWLPMYFMLALSTSLGIGLWLSALNLKYRDFRYVVPFITQLWLFVTPIAYPASMVPERWQLLYGLNPMAGVVRGFRWCLLNSPNESSSVVLASSMASFVVLVSGAIYFRRMEKSFADIA